MLEADHQLYLAPSESSSLAIELGTDQSRDEGSEVESCLNWAE